VYTAKVTKEIYLVRCHHCLRRHYLEFEFVRSSRSWGNGSFFLL